MLLRLCILISLVLAPSVAWAEAERRVALVIGNAQYRNAPLLDNPGNDATDIAAALGRLDFDTNLVLDADYQTMQTALRDFSRAAAQADLSLVYFAGHGIEVDQVNYLIPVNAELQQGGDVAFEAVQLDLVMQSLVSAPGVKIVLVDACRNNPFANRLQDAEGSRSIGTGLGRVDPIGGVQAGGILVGYAAREGTVALDGAGRNSPYAQALLEFIEEPGLEVSKLFRRVRDRVFQLTNGAQEPFTYGALPGADLFFRPISRQVDISAGSAASSVNSNLLADFAIADATNTLKAWQEFVDKHRANQSDALVQIALRRKTELQQQLDDMQPQQRPEPWLIPQSGRKAPPLALNRQERMQVQKALIYMGYNIGGVDGQFGPKTRQAISAARRATGLPPGTAVDLALLTALPNPKLVDGMRSSEARAYDSVDLDPFLEPRLRNALLQLTSFEVVFDYFEGRLYLVVIGQGFGSWEFKNAISGRAGGHLATISSAQEDRFIHQLFSRDEKFVSRSSDGLWRGPVIGLVQHPDGREPNGGWGWVTGEPLTYTNWDRGQPDHQSWREDAASYSGRGANGRSAKFWNDTQGNWKSFVIEIE